MIERYGSFNIHRRWQNVTKYLGFCHLDSLARAAAAHWNKNKIKILSKSVLRETVTGGFLLFDHCHKWWNWDEGGKLFCKTLKPWRYLGTHWPFSKGCGRSQRNVSLRWDSSRCLEVLSVSNQNSHLSTFKTIQTLLSRGQCRFSGSQKGKEFISCCTKMGTNLTFSRVEFFSCWGISEPSASTFYYNPLQHSPLLPRLGARGIIVAWSKW